MSRIRFLAAALLLAGAIPLVAREPVQKVYAVADLVVPCGNVCVGEEECELPACCTQFGAWAAGLGQPKKTDEDKLIKMVTGTVRPLCWKQNGGQCSIEYFPIGMGLVVHAPADVQKDVSDLLDSLRRTQDRQICFTLRFVTVSECFFERLGGWEHANCAGCQSGKTVCTVGKDGLQRIGCDFDHPGCCPDGDCCCEKDCCPLCKDCCEKCCKSLVLTEEQVRQFLEAVEGDRRANVMSAPRMTLLDGQVGSFSSQDRQQYVTGVSVKVVDGKQRVEPDMTSHATGLKASLCGKLAADGKHVVVALDMSYTHLDSPHVPLMPVTYFVEPEFADGGKGQPIPFTQFLQQPKFGTLKIDSHFNIPVGATMVLDAGKFVTDVRTESRVPVLSKIPYVGRMFKKVETGRECERMLVLVTPTVVSCEAEACPPACVGCCPACPNCQAVATASAHCGHEVCLGSLVFPAAKACCDLTCQAVKPCALATESRTAAVAAKLVKKYHDACTAGHHEEAREFAQMALELDPMCFAKPCTAPAMVPVTTPTMPVPTMPIQVVPQFQIPPPPPMPEPQAPVEQHSRRFFRRVFDGLSNNWVGGITLPSGYYQDHRPQYFRPDPDFPLEKELAAQQAIDRQVLGPVFPHVNLPVVPAGMPVVPSRILPAPPVPPVPPQMIQAIQEDLNRRLPPRFVAPPAPQR